VGVKMTKNDFEAGEIVEMTEGCYSDFGRIGFVKVLHPFKVMDVLPAFLKTDPHSSLENSFDQSRFLDYPDVYDCHRRDERGRFVDDPLRFYRHPDMKLIESYMRAPAPTRSEERK